MKSNNNEDWLSALFAKEQWSEDDRQRLLEYLNETDNQAMRDLMEERFLGDMDGPQADSATKDRLLSLIHEKINPDKSKDRLIWMTGWKRWAIAAVLLLIAGKVVFNIIASKPNRGTSPAKPVAQNMNDRPAGIQNAILTLGDGSVITLDSAANGKLAQQGNTKIIKLNGQISYTNETSGNTTPLLNTITTARGNQYMLVLSDGSKVWLNAASSLRFPTSFRGNERKVEITGEAYFEVAKNPAMPFKVMAAGGEIQVLGTHFNVNAYSDESAVKTTLLEGKVLVQKESSRLVLLPGQQAKFRPQTLSGDAAEAITLIKDVDTEQETAWKNGFFWFDNTDIHTLMRQVSRWYDVEVEFKGNFTDDGFSGKVPRNVPLSKFLKILEQYEIHFSIEGKKITVQP